MSQPPNQHHCKECSLYFDSGNSLDVHLQYHKENLLSKWGISSGEESNNNVKASNTPKERATSVPADSSDTVLDRFSPNFNIPINRSSPPNSYIYSDMRPPSVGQDNGSRPNSNFNQNADPDFILGSGSGFPQNRSSPAPPSPSHANMLNNSTPRFHPYQQTLYRPTHHEQRNGGTVVLSQNVMPHLQTPIQCEKCGFICDNTTLLIQHIQNTHSSTPDNTFSYNQDYMRPPDIKIEPQAEILDLDSHKVHVYQPPQEGVQSSQIDPGMPPWMPGMQDKKLYNPMHINGRIQSPDFNVTTTTLNVNEMPQLPYYEHPVTSPNPHAHLQQITSSQMPMGTPKPGMQTLPKSSNNASWKSNEARRPKTYNCTACNKWFTSSGHLKRHYNTTLHKNAVKQSGIPDPANLPVSNHHHPPKDPAPPYRGSPPCRGSPPTNHLEDNQLLPIKMEDNRFDRNQVGDNGSNFLSNPPNSQAGPSEVTGGLLLHSTQFQTNPEVMRLEQGSLAQMHQQHQNFLTYTGAPHHTYPQGLTMYPNLQPPHVSSTQQTATSKITGNSAMLEQNEDQQQIWGQNGELKSLREELIALTNPAQTQLPAFSNFANNLSGFSKTRALYENLSATGMSQSNVGGLSRGSSLESYSAQSPNSGYQLSTTLHSSEQETMSTSSDSMAAPHSVGSCNYEDYSSPENHLPSSTEDYAEKCISLEHVKVEDTVSSTVQNSPPQQIKCLDCDKVFNKACYLTQHNKSFHTGDRPYKCDKCGKRFEMEAQRLDHMRKHAGDKPYKCDSCPKQFNHKTDLRRHMCHHSGEKPYSCHICGKGFIRKDHMVKHCDTHKKKPAFSPHVKSVLFQKQVDIEPYDIDISDHVVKDH